MLAKSPNQVGQVRPYSTSGTLFLYFVQQKYQNIARMIEMHGWAIPQITEWSLKYRVIKTTEKLIQSSK